ncbi:hypothetical protein FNO01nite_19450 [Flavobacterium noncentrifugens]|uniref:S1 RNA binding domain-containing protein n=1 Tax=Flavobacterium noncentrifugens TaxID=1128970 RepID=A0A1G8YLN5_9FLAO|nr:RNA-binding domain-containing protein [Flavobacterium noncentrifugens]GEP51273.1 hypothetical protein FNO01nite_19450 [Flavobacterium noncentrifugens]SDK03681.1 S1 RNA binding domain-containing protein [Flavobacterium noncentrifugens]
MAIDFEIGTLSEYKILKKERFNDLLFFYIETPFGEIKIKGFDWQENQATLICKIIRHIKQYPILENSDLRNNYYQLNQIFSFDIKDFGYFIDKREEKCNSIIVADIHFNEIEIRAKEWQTKSLWKFKDLNCKVIGLRADGIVKLENMDERHPIYEKGKSYKFEITGSKEYQKDDRLFKVILLIDKYGFTYEVPAYRTSIINLKITEQISCIVDKVTFKVFLNQEISDDPYFFEFNEIIDNHHYYKSYFLPKLLDSEDKNCKQMKSQYDEKSGFYILTYCNKILPNILSENIKRKNFKIAIEVNSLLFEIETWILKRGIIRALPSESARKLIKEKVNLQIQTSKHLEVVLPIIQNNRFADYYDQETYYIEEIFYLLYYSDIKLLEPLKIVDCLKKTDLKNPSHTYYLEKLIRTVGVKKKEFQQFNSEDYFSIAKLDKVQDNQDLELYMSWTYCQILILDALNKKEESNYFKAQILRYSLYYESDINVKIKLLQNAFHFVENYNDLELEIPILKNQKFAIDSFKLVDNPNIIRNGIDSWEEIKASINSNNYLEVEVLQEHYLGFKVRYKGVNGYLPTHLINDVNLKNYLHENINWITRVNCTSYSEDFNYFICEQLSIDHESYFSKNLLNISSLKIDQILKGKIKSITEYGLFVSTIHGDALLHKSKLSDDYWDFNQLNKFFKIRQHITVVVKRITPDNKFELSYRDLDFTDFRDEYQHFLSKIEALNYNINFEESDTTEKESFNIKHLIEIEKGFIFEKYATIQKVISKKIAYINLAKQFFSNTKNSRSFLLNIYIEYFNCLLMLEKIIENYSFEKYEILKQKLNIIKAEISPKTIESYPETEKLIYFVSILSLFNECSEDSFQTLLEYVKEYSNNKSNDLLKIIAKVTLSNNLLVSESIENNDFSCNNLKRINKYISDGVFSLIETEEDKLQRELNEERKYWTGRIMEDEGENIEFKATFKTPVPDEQKQKQISSLENELLKSNNPETIKSKIAEIKGLNIEKTIIHSSLKTIAAFANTIGGHLLIGVSDDKTVFGLEQDYSSFKAKKEQNRDGFGKFFDAKLKEYFGESFSSILLKKKFLKFNEGDILIIEVKPSSEEVFLLKDDNGKASEALYIRNLSSSEKLNGKELAKFVREKFRNQISNIEVQ